MRNSFILGGKPDRWQKNQNPVNYPALLREDGECVAQVSCYSGQVLYPSSLVLSPPIGWKN